MQASLALFRFVAKTALDCAGFGVAGESVAEVLPDMARTLYQRWVAGRPDGEIRAEIREVARLGDDEAAPGVTPDIHLSLVTYLAQIPSAGRSGATMTS